MGDVALGAGASVLQNKGFGVLLDCGAGACTSFSDDYPQATFQFLAALQGSGASATGLYFGAHDPHAAMKGFAFKSLLGKGTFSVSVVVGDAGRPAQGSVVSFPVVVRAFAGDWWDGAMIYRAFVLASADWTQQGPLSNRSDVPDWLYNITTWVNSHWSVKNLEKSLSHTQRETGNEIENGENGGNKEEKGGRGRTSQIKQAGDRNCKSWVLSFFFDEEKMVRERRKK